MQQHCRIVCYTVSLEGFLDAELLIDQIHGHNDAQRPLGPDVLPFGSKDAPFLRSIVDEANKPTLLKRVGIVRCKAIKGNKSRGLKKIGIVVSKTGPIFLRKRFLVANA